ncbi:MAG: ATP-binding cassette domain-containing protein [Deltaproteobacteria bacterium]|nr:ATP-binding cassette domain-containing protein [Deltaproteobacteria bacterium]
MIEVKELIKDFDGHPAVDGITFQVGKGEVLGFLGPNGAGKSTTMKIITCFLPPTAGTVVVGGHDIHQAPVAVREQIGYLPESAATYPEMTVEEFLRFMAQMRGIDGADTARQTDRVMELTSLREVRGQVIETLSKGYRQRTCLAQALIHDPPVLILDEPTDGLDPNQKHEMRQLIRRMGEQKTIILSTHILEEMEAVCSRAVIIAKGRLRMDGTPGEMAAMSRYHQAVTIFPHTDDQGKLKERLAGISGVETVEYTGPRDGTHRYTLFPQTGKTIHPDVHSFLEKQKISVDQVFVERGRVDEVFRRLTLGDEAPVTGS